MMPSFEPVQAIVKAPPPVMRETGRSTSSGQRPSFAAALDAANKEGPSPDAKDAASAGVATDTAGETRNVPGPQPDAPRQEAAATTDQPAQPAQGDGIGEAACLAASAAMPLVIDLFAAANLSETAPEYPLEPVLSETKATVQAPALDLPPVTTAVAEAVTVAASVMPAVDGDDESVAARNRLPVQELPTRSTMFPTDPALLADCAEQPAPVPATDTLPIDMQAPGLQEMEKAQGQQSQGQQPARAGIDGQAAVGSRAREAAPPGRDAVHHQGGGAGITTASDPDITAFAGGKAQGPSAVPGPVVSESAPVLPEKPVITGADTTAAGPASMGEAVSDKGAAPAVKTASAPALPAEPVVTQIVDKAGLHAGSGEMRIELKPEFLGPLKIRVATENHMVTLKIVTEVPMVKEMIESQIHLLKNELGLHGLHIDKVDVSVARDFDPYDEARREQAFQSAKDNRDSRNRPAGQGRHQGGGRGPFQRQFGQAGVDHFA